MLEISIKHVVCGGLIIGGEFAPLYCNPETGTVAFEDEVDGSVMAVGEVSVTNPLEIINFDTIATGLMSNNYADAIGLIFKKDGEVIAIMSEYSAEIRPLASLRLHSQKTIDVDLNYEYDEEIIDTEPED